VGFPGQGPWPGAATRSTPSPPTAAGRP